MEDSHDEAGGSSDAEFMGCEEEEQYEGEGGSSDEEQGRAWECSLCDQRVSLPLRNCDRCGAVNVSVHGGGGGYGACVGSLHLVTSLTVKAMVRALDPSI